MVYCLKSRINHLFMRKMLEGMLDEVLGRTVIIVDEVAPTPTPCDKPCVCACGFVSRLHTPVS